MSYRYADAFDILYIVLGTLGAMGNGAVRNSLCLLPPYTVDCRP